MPYQQQSPIAMILMTIIIGDFYFATTRSLAASAGLFFRACVFRPVIGQAEKSDQACPSRHQDHLPDQNDLYGHDA